MFIGVRWRYLYLFICFFLSESGNASEAEYIEPLSCPSQLSDYEFDFPPAVRCESSDEDQAFSCQDNEEPTTGVQKSSPSVEGLRILSQEEYQGNMIEDQTPPSSPWAWQVSQEECQDNKKDNIEKPLIGLTKRPVEIYYDDNPAKRRASSAFSEISPKTPLLEDTPLLLPNVNNTKDNEESIPSDVFNAMARRCLREITKENLCAYRFSTADLLTIRDNSPSALKQAINTLGKRKRRLKTFIRFSTEELITI